MYLKFRGRLRGELTQLVECMLSMHKELVECMLSMHKVAGSIPAFSILFYRVVLCLCAKMVRRGPWRSCESFLDLSYMEQRVTPVRHGATSYRYLPIATKLAKETVKRILWQFIDSRIGRPSFHP
jgi:hypothetical protein